MKKHEIGTLRKTKKPQILSNLKKGNFFRTSYEFFKDWDERSDEERENINPMEKMGVYCIVFSMLEDRLETLWWNCSYVHGWKVIGHWDDERNRYVTDNGRPPQEYEHKGRKIPTPIRTTGKFRIDLLKNGKISQTLHDRIHQSEKDRKELIHRNMFFMGDLRNKHITEVMTLFRQVDKLVQKHKKGHPDKLS
jgi:hypothetical protein